jgi:hypothetical protein
MVKPIFTSIFCIWAPSEYHYFPEAACTILFREIVYTNYWNLIRIIGVVSKKIAILCFGAHLKGLYFWSYTVKSLGTNLGRINCWILNMNKIHPIQALMRHTCIYIQTGSIPKTTSLYSEGLRMCKSAKGLRYIFHNHSTFIYIFIYLLCIWESKKKKKSAVHPFPKVPV